MAPYVNQTSTPTPDYIHSTTTNSTKRRKKNKLASPSSFVVYYFSHYYTRCSLTHSFIHWFHIQHLHIKSQSMSCVVLAFSFMMVRLSTTVVCIMITIMVSSVHSLLMLLLRPHQTLTTKYCWLDHSHYLFVVVYGHSGSIQN